MQKLTPEAVKLGNLKMWLQEQIERYGALAARNRGSFQETSFASQKIAFETVLTRLAEDEK
jgi:hypothetical protein